MVQIFVIILDRMLDKLLKYSFPLIAKRAMKTKVMK